MNYVDNSYDLEFRHLFFYSVFSFLQSHHKSQIHVMSSRFQSYQPAGQPHPLHLELNPLSCVKELVFHSELDSQF